MKRLIVIALFAVAAQATNVCPNYVRTLSSAATCSFGKCKAASCDGNMINKSGFEQECTIDKNGYNKGAKCPWESASYGVYCDYVGGCEVGKKNNCFGYTACKVGDCPSSSTGFVCIESGVSNNFKVCRCNDAECVVSAWTPWGTCVDRTQFRTRTVVTPQSGNGAACPSLSEQKACVPDVDCVISPWGAWGPCEDNVSTRSRSIVISNSGNGKQCPELTETQTCFPECTVKTKADFYVTAYNKQLVASKSVLANDFEAVAAEIVDEPSNGRIEFINDGLFKYTPSLNWCGTDTFTYKALNKDCYVQETVTITTTCGCGSTVGYYSCTLDLTQASTQCVLPGGQVVVVPNAEGYKRVVLRLSAKPSYKTK